MKKLLLIAIAFCTFTACDDDDNSELWDEVKNQGNKIEMLESEIEALKLKIEGLNQTYKAISEMLNGGLITGVEEVTDGDKKGYTFTVQTGTEINTYTIWNGETVAAPQLGVEKEEETGLYYWTLDGEPLLNADGEKIYSAKAPQLRINSSSEWEISYDDGATWKNLGVFTGTVVGNSIEVELVDGVVVIKQDGKTDIEIPLTPKNTLGITFTNIDAAAGMIVMKNGVYLVEYKLENVSENAYVKAEALNGTNFDVVNFPAEKKFKIAVKGQMTSDVILVHVYDGGVCMHTSFNIAPSSSIKAITIDEPEVLWGLEAGSDNVEYEGTLTLAEAASEDLTFSVIPVGTYSSDIFTVEPTVTISTGETEGKYKVTAKRSAMTAGTAYTIPSIIFSGENTGYHVGGAVTMTAGVLAEILLTADMLESKYTSVASGDGDNIGFLCDGDINTYWGSNYSNTCPNGDATYGVYIDINLPKSLIGVKFRYCTRNTNNAVPKALVVGVSNVGDRWDTLFTNDGTGLPTDTYSWGEDDVLHSLSGGVLFTKIRFGITRSSYNGGSDLITTPKASTAFAELKIYGLYGQ